MSSLLLSIDTHHATIFHYLPSGLQKETIDMSGLSHPTETQGKNHPLHQTDEDKFYHEVCTRLEKITATEWLIVGGGQGPDHFKNHLNRHHPHLLERIKETQKVPKMSEAQLIDYGNSFFRKMHIFQSLQP